jgi:hypothetical protein
MGGACSTYVGDEKYIHISIGESEGKRLLAMLGSAGVIERTVLKWNLKK